MSVLMTAADRKAYLAWRDKTLPWRKRVLEETWNLVRKACWLDKGKIPDFVYKRVDRVENALFFATHAGRVRFDPQEPLPLVESLVLTLNYPRSASNILGERYFGASFASGSAEYPPLCAPGIAPAIDQFADRLYRAEFDRTIAEEIADLRRFRAARVRDEDDAAVERIDRKIAYLKRKRASFDASVRGTFLLDEERRGKD